MGKENIEVSKVLGPLLNQVLFGDSKKPVFDSGKLYLDKRFNHVYSNYEKSSGTKLMEKYIETQIHFVLKAFVQIERAVIVKIIFNDPIFLHGMMVFGLIENGGNLSQDPELVKAKIGSEIIDYLFTDGVNTYINWYFKLFFQELFHLEFLNKDFVSEKEYQNLYDRFTIARSLIEMS